MDFHHYGDPLAEIGHIWGFWTLSGERVGVNVEGRAEAYFESSSLSYNTKWGQLYAECFIYYNFIQSPIISTG